MNTTASEVLPNAYAIVDDDGDINPHFGAFLSESDAARAVAGATRRRGFMHPRVVAVSAYFSRYHVVARPELIPGSATWPASHGPHETGCPVGGPPRAGHTCPGCAPLYNARVRA